MARCRVSIECMVCTECTYIIRRVYSPRRAVERRGGPVCPDERFRPFVSRHVSHEIRSTVGRSFLIEDLPRTQLTYDTTYRSGSSTHPCATRPGARTSRRMGDLSRPRPRTVPSRSARARQRSGIQRPGRATRCSASIRPPTRTIDFGLRARESQQARVRGGRGSQGACLGRGRVRRRRSNPKGRTGG